MEDISTAHSNIKKTYGQEIFRILANNDTLSSENNRLLNKYASILYVNLLDDLSKKLMESIARFSKEPNSSTRENALYHIIKYNTDPNIKYERVQVSDKVLDSSKMFYAPKINKCIECYLN